MDEQNNQEDTDSSSGTSSLAQSPLLWLLLQLSHQKDG
jgi:hypothetical protein